MNLAVAQGLLFVDHEISTSHLGLEQQLALQVQLHAQGEIHTQSHPVLHYVINMMDRLVVQVFVMHAHVRLYWSHAWYVF